MSLPFTSNKIMLSKATDFNSISKNSSAQLGHQKRQIAEFLIGKIIETTVTEIQLSAKVALDCLTNTGTCHENIAPHSAGHNGNSTTNASKHEETPSLSNCTEPRHGSKLKPVIHCKRADKKTTVREFGGIDPKPVVSDKPNLNLDYPKDQMVTRMGPSPKPHIIPHPPPEYTLAA